MTKNNSKNNHSIPPIEKHDTAAWADVHELKPVSNVSIPSEFQVINSKEWVDENEK